MKKLLTVLAVLLCILSLAGCKKEEPEPQIVGGWTDEEEELDDELIAIFESAVEGLVGVGYKPVKLLSKQVVAGMNYEFLAEATTVTAEPVTSYKVVKIYVNLEGKAEITDISDYTE